MSANDLIYTSVSDALVDATYEKPATIRRAIAIERKSKKPRTALITGLERELRRRKKIASPES